MAARGIDGFPEGPNRLKTSTALRDEPHAQIHAFVADEDRRSGDEVLDFVASLATERAVEDPFLDVVARLSHRLTRRTAAFPHLAFQRLFPSLFVDTVTEAYAFIANSDPLPDNQLPRLILGLATERAALVSLFLGHVTCSSNASSLSRATGIGEGAKALIVRVVLRTVQSGTAGG